MNNQKRRGDQPRAYHHPEGPFGRHEDAPHGHQFGPGRGRGRGPRGRMARGDVRNTILLLLTEQPMHGYQLMQAVADRSGGRWTPSPGAIYPAISQLEDEGLVSVTAESGRKLVALSAEGSAYVEANRANWADPFTPFEGDANRVDLRSILAQVIDATRQVGRSGTEAQRGKAAKVLDETRRALYLILAEAPAAE